MSHGAFQSSSSLEVSQSAFNAFHSSSSSSCALCLDQAGLFFFTNGAPRRRSYYQGFFPSTHKAPKSVDSDVFQSELPSFGPSWVPCAFLPSPTSGLPPTLHTNLRNCTMSPATPTPLPIFIIVIPWLVLCAFAFYNFGTSSDYLCEAREWRDVICRLCLSVFIIIIIILLHLRPMYMLCPLCPSRHRSFFHTKLRHGTKHDCRNRLQCSSSSPTFV